MLSFVKYPHTHLHMPIASPEDHTEIGNTDWFYRREERSGLLEKEGTDLLFTVDLLYLRNVASYTFMSYSKRVNYFKLSF